jgi:hypothetical protein
MRICPELACGGEVCASVGDDLAALGIVSDGVEARGLPCGILRVSYWESLTTKDLHIRYLTRLTQTFVPQSSAIAAIVRVHRQDREE